jgi:hypothetical protein
MDIASMLRATVLGVPEGDYSSGLRAIVRHVDAAIKHYERGLATQDDDSYTDSIYRTNQAFEGALKEAFRAISGENPSKKSLFDIENYLQTHNLRKRVLTQITRYREDYRNPSTHDYKLDFDENEALLAILSVTAFSKLLVDQIAEKIKFEEAKKAIDQSEEVPEILDKEPSHIFYIVSDYVHKFLNNSSLKGETARDNTSLISAYLSKANLDISSPLEIYSVNDNDTVINWDIVININEIPSIAFDIKSSRGRQSKNITNDRILSLVNYLQDSNINMGILVEGVPRGETYELSEHHIADDVKIIRMGRKWELV